MANDQAMKALGGQVPLRFKQIAVGQSGADGNTDPIIFGLTEDGAVYQYCQGASYLKETRELININGHKYNSHYGPSFYWWQPLRMSTEKGAESEPPATPKEFLE